MTLSGMASSRTTFKATRPTATVCILFGVAMLIAGCGPVSKSVPLASGTPKEVVLAKIKAAPISKQTFAVANHPGLTFTIYTYRFAKEDGDGTRTEWLMFDRNGFVGRGPGDARDARARAFELYYTAMAAHGALKKSEAEAALLGQLRQVFGGRLNRRAEYYLAQRQALYQDLEAEKIKREEADERLRKLTVSIVGSRRIAEDGTIDRWQTLEIIGLSGARRLPDASHRDVSCLSRHLSGSTVGRSCRSRISP